ncbi:MAG: right-handed parallel beta-helix repeat-containing protein [Clostridia bacterium]|nr:right-handed parallel beta-helix repeat-containing protein [Clostridia bacterium]
MNKIILDISAKEEFQKQFSRAIELVKRTPGTTLVIPAGEYTVSGERAKWAQKSLFEGAFGKFPQPSMFNPKYVYDRGLDLTGVKNAVIDARGVTLLVDGYMEPVTVANCENLEIVGLTVDHVRKPFSRGVIEKIKAFGDELRLEVRLDEGNEVHARTPNMIRHLILDPETKESICVQFKKYDFVDKNRLIFWVKEHVRQGVVKEGMLFYTIHSCHSRPGILLENSKNITLTDVTIHSQPGMGIVGNRCEDVYIRGLRVVPSKGDHVSTASDATHFTAMKGDLIFENCEAGWQGDDFTNVHAYFHDVAYEYGDNTYLLREKTPDGTHAQSLDYPDEGDILELVSHATLEKLGEYRVVSCEPRHEDWACKVTLDRALPEDTRGMMLADVTRLPHVEVRNCYIHDHFARGILLKNRDSLVENCRFENVQGPAVVAAAESWWYEGVCPANITVRNNSVKNCAAFWGEAAGVVVKADCEKATGQSIFNITVENNTVEAPECAHGVYVRNVKGFYISGNEINCAKEPVVTENCDGDCQSADKSLIKGVRK